MQQIYSHAPKGVEMTLSPLEIFAWHTQMWNLLHFWLQTSVVHFPAYQDWVFGWNEWKTGQFGLARGLARGVPLEATLVAPHVGCSSVTGSSKPQELWFSAWLSCVSHRYFSQQHLCCIFFTTDKTRACHLTRHMKLSILAMFVQTPTQLQQLQVKHSLSKHLCARCTFSSQLSSIPSASWAQTMWPKAPTLWCSVDALLNKTRANQLIKFKHDATKRWSILEHAKAFCTREGARREQKSIGKWMIGGVCGFFGLWKCWHQARVIVFVSCFCWRKHEVRNF